MGAYCIYVTFGATPQGGPKDKQEKSDDGFIYFRDPNV